jgi:hypothetical protein
MELSLVVLPKEGCCQICKCGPWVIMTHLLSLVGKCVAVSFLCIIVFPSFRNTTKFVGMMIFMKIHIVRSLHLFKLYIVYCVSHSYGQLSLDLSTGA